MGNPKAFISYSWSNPKHEQWVIDLATELRQSSRHDSLEFLRGHSEGLLVLITIPEEMIPFSND